ncbi:MAG TPA: dihydrofolate reductase [Candidatus Saccharimonadales bacterium]|nr:dihydrofolate reductase [Candidatus Saccharimonadales bacterium]
MNSPLISMIAIISKNRGLGKDNKLLFHIPGELPRFKKITMGHPVIMGRKTFESLNRPSGLPGRLNIVVSHNVSYNQSGEFPGVLFFTSIEAALERAKKEDQQEVFIIGGGQLYEQAMPFANRLYLTVVDTETEADTFFPEYSAFTKVIEKEEHEEAGYKYTFLTMEK